MFLIKGHLVAPHGVLFGGALCIEGKHIQEIILPEDVSSFVIDKGKELMIFDFQDCYVFPGFIDLHIHGALGLDFMDGKPEGVLQITRFLLQEGVTRFLATTLTQSRENILKAIGAIVHVARDIPSILGIHLEGPYLSYRRRGAHNPRFLRRPVLSEIEEFLNAGNGFVKRVTLAPELEGAMEAVSFLSSQGILVSLGHSEADYATSFRAFLQGARLITHIFNGMDSLHHRMPNLLSFALGFEGVFVELIADGIHVAPEVAKIVFACKPDKTVIVSDAIRATGVEDGIYEMGGETIEVRKGIARLASSGNLAGSTTTLRLSLFNLWREFRFSLSQLAWMGSLLPAKLLGVDRVLGSLEKGKLADIVVLDDSFTVRAVFVEGRKVHPLEAP